MERDGRNPSALWKVREKGQQSLSWVLLCNRQLTAPSTLAQSIQERDFHFTERYNMKDVKQKIVEILTSAVLMSKKLTELDDVIGGDSFIEMFGHELDVIEDAVLDMCGVPKERTPFVLLGIDTSNDHPSQIEYGFCRDNIKGTIFNFFELDYEDIPLACDSYVIELLTDWLPDYETIYEDLP